MNELPDTVTVPPMSMPPPFAEDRLFTTLEFVRVSVP